MRARSRNEDGLVPPLPEIQFLQYSGMAQPSLAQRWQGHGPLSAA